MPRGSIPYTDDGLLGWSLNFSTRISEAAPSYGLTAAQATAYAAQHAAYAVALAAVEPNVRNKALVAVKNSARTSLKNAARSLALIVQGSPVTDAQKLELGLTVRAHAVPIPAPTDSPKIGFGERLGTSIVLYLGEGVGKRRCRPDGAQGARVYSFIGPVPPVGADAWKFEGQATKSEVEIAFPPTTPPGTLVWFTAQWYNAKGETGPGADPISTNIAGGASLQKAA